MQVLTGYLGESASFCSAWVEGATVKVRFFTDASVVSRGFRVYRVESKRAHPVEAHFPGQWLERETVVKDATTQTTVYAGLHNNWHRFYDPETARYITPDPLGLRAGMNPFAYVEGDPVNFSDPTGLYTSLHNPEMGAVMLMLAGRAAVGGAATVVAGAYLQGPAGQPVRDALGGACEAAGNAVQGAFRAARRQLPKSGPPTLRQPNFEPLPPATTFTEPEDDKPKTQRIYRAMSLEEWKDIKITGTFRGHPTGHGYGGKQFGNNPNETITFANIFSDIDIVVEVVVPKSTYDAFDHTPVDPHIFRSGTVTVHPGLPMTLLNSTKQSVRVIYP